MGSYENFAYPNAHASKMCGLHKQFDTWIVVFGIGYMLISRSLRLA